MRPASFRWVLSLWLTVGACGTEARERHSPRQDEPRAHPREIAGSPDDPTVLATAAGTTITVGEVVGLAREAELTPRGALDRLIGEALLAKEAERRGYGARPEVAAGAQRAAVRAWLVAEVERGVPASSVTDQDVATAYGAQRARFSRPEARTAVHVLLPLAADADQARIDAAQRLTGRVVAELRAAGPDAVLARYSADPLAVSGAFQVTAERVPELVRGGAFDPAFLEAVFALSAPGVVPAPVRTQFGWHAIALTEIRPDASLPLERAHAIVRQELLAERRGTLLGSLVERIAAQTPPLADRQLAARLEAVPQEDLAAPPPGAP